MICEDRAYFVLVQESLCCLGVLRGRVAQGGGFRWPAIEHSTDVDKDGSTLKSITVNDKLLHGWMGNH